MKTLILKKIILTFTLFYSVCGNIQSQEGCTDSLANNFKKDATENNGSCVYKADMVSIISAYPLDDVLSETSGLIYWEDMLWTHNDSQDPILYKINPADGAISGNLSLEPQINVDWEEISLDEHYIYIGDFGNNENGNRRDLKIIRVSKSSILSTTPEMDNIYFSYEDQTDYSPQGPNNTDLDCEAFIITDDSIFLFTKAWKTYKTRVYKLPKTPGAHTAKLHSFYNINGLITGAVYKKTEGIIALSGYDFLLQPFVFLLYDFKGNDFFGGNKRKLHIDLPFYQVEAITTNDGLNYFITNERFDPTGTMQHLYTLDLSPYLEHYLLQK
ncbi:T9SS C-terminal target domain-containing protein [Aequorivita sp. H23M31]|uniref:T9SS C-terminal target domain-containing protein n=1 Tax=Aequorivita ciconiae TaxID=2494375 RepID=A0A410G4S8_9FLAO|nr:T9SS C-terminal target domain-containing protein [Aequorivita sp. H23M31]QAA82282.1 T9SS C-terminal target domain-containing protein [Aequorivita sp. H23M31]